MRLRKVVVVAVSLIVAASRVALAQPGEPTISATPTYGQYQPGTVLTVTVTYCDNAGLDTASRTLTVNNVDVKNTWTKSTSSAGPGPCFAQFIQSGTVTVPATVRASIEDNGGIWSRVQTFAYTAPNAWRGLRVVAENEFLDAHPSVAGTYRFKAYNIGTVAEAMTFAVVNSGMTSPSAPSPSSATINPNDSVTVTVTATTPASAGAEARLWLRATAGGRSDSAMTQVNTVPATTPSNGVVLLNPKGTVERSLCVTINVGPSAAYECGDLRLTYALPGVRTRTRDRTPTLHYLSSAAHPQPTVPALLTITNPGVGETVSATVVFTAGGPLAGTSFAAGSWTAADWGTGGVRRITPMFDGAAVPTGRHPYRLDIARAGGVVYSASGELLVVNRLASAFGAGWWLAGLEQIVMPTDTSSQLAWIGGDASIRVFRKSGGYCRWVGDSLDRQDLIVATQSGSNCVNFERQGPNALQVKFDASGRHMATINRLRDTTTFVYGAGGRLDQILLPSGSLAMAYGFTYSGAGVLQSVQAPGLTVGAPRNVTVQTVNGGSIAGAQRPRISEIQYAATGTPVPIRFEYDGAPPVNGLGGYRASGRRDRTNNLTGFVYDASAKLAESMVRASAAETIRVLYRAAEGKGRGAGTSGSALHVDSAYTGLDGPRNDVADVVKWWVNALGSPLRIRDPVGAETRVRYSDVWPALPDTVFDAAGVRSTVVYNGRGLPESVSQRAPFGGANATTSVEYHATWDFPLVVVDPTGIATRRTFSPSTGNVLTERVGTSSSFDYAFEYDSLSLLRRIFTPGQAIPDSLSYDGERRNLSRGRTARGVITRRVQDRVGRDTLVIEPIDVVTDTVTRVQRTRIAYDSLDRVREVQAIGAEMPYTLPSAPVIPFTVNAETLFTIYTRDPEGRPLIVRNLARPSDTGADTCGTGAPPPCAKPLAFDPSIDTLTYDWVGRLLGAHLGSGPRRRVFDLAGNVVVDSMRNGKAIRYTYDAASRLIRQTTQEEFYFQENCTDLPHGILFPVGSCYMTFPIYPNWGGTGFRVPDDTSRFAYDYAGRLTRADNGDARVSRSYFPTGALRTDSLRVRSYTTSSFDATVFGLAYAYDLAGRRTGLSLPSALGDGTVVTEFDIERGLLSRISQASTRIDFAYDLASRDTLLTFSKVTGGVPTAGLVERRRFGLDGLPVYRERKRTNGTGILSDSLEYDARGKIRTVFASSAVLDIGTYTQQIRYAGLGAVVASETSKGGAWWEAEQFRTSALGQVYYSRADRGADPARPPLVSYFDSLGVLFARRPIRATPADTIYDDTTFAKHSSANNVRLSGSRSQTATATNRTYSATRNYYRTDGRLAATQRYFATDPYRAGAWEEYRYDAFGRRVLSRTRRQGGSGYQVLCTLDCVGTIERTVWDGQQILYELRADGSDDRTPAQLDQLTSTGLHWGKVGYVNGSAMDQPLFQTNGRIPNYNWRGLAESSVWADGSSADCALWPSSGCTTVAWTSGASVYYKALPWSGSTPNPQWIGTVILNGATATGQMYRRNRNYDPATGQFTQPDPIGLAGGVNLYGYAGGDPINRHDPFGLRDTVIADDGARQAVNDCAQVEICRQWLDYLAKDPRTFTIRSGTPSQPSYFGEADLHFDTQSGILAGADVLVDADFSRIARRGQSPGGVLAHELGGHVVGTLMLQHLGFRGSSNICGDASPPRVGMGCAESQRLRWAAARGTQ